VRLSVNKLNTGQEIDLEVTMMQFIVNV